MVSRMVRSLETLGYLTRSRPKHSGVPSKRAGFTPAAAATPRRH
jgi:hypothetical protein